MSCPITIYKNNDLLIEAKNIQQAAEFLAELFNTTKNKFYDHIERGYVYHIPYYIGEDEYRFVAPAGIAANRRKNLEDSGHKNARRLWLIPANPNDYDVEGAFSYYYDTLDWKRSYNYENGDILFIYVSGNVKRVRYKVEVIEGIVRDNDIIYDQTFWKDEEKYLQSQEYERSRVRLVDENDTPDLSLAKLRDYGLKGNIQGAMKLKGELRDYIMSFFEHNLTEGYYPDEVTGTLEEGKRKTISVNVYERNPIARKKCMDYYGAECQVCKMNFEDTYGKVGRDFIHVHHIIPLHEIQQDYIVDPIKDLIPVCPNCHAMLHRKENGAYLSIEQLRERISKE
ncbi:HNH endonuclease [Bacillus luteolus]|uniref:HNH endonuclease n=1 Tax=Litchfieldia luteola TaxID=682179 RepID=A0ABR9QL27_9BACI|nr:HNH endonuclease [Cytobacillus luteolus]MBE4909203.1 HNH endonuclease [Cytobacillus luteolus]MBP1940343.1 5-methylcytosine-specific restriction protein A [Cytobacillus luteolus]